MHGNHLAETRETSMKNRKRNDDPLHDGSPGSYFARFVICFILGVIMELILLFTVHWFVFEEFIEVAYRWWPVWPVIPLAMGVAGIFKFDWIVAVYDYFHKDYGAGR